MTYIAKDSSKQETILSTLTGKVRVYYIDSIKRFYVQRIINPSKIAGYFASHLCILNPSFRYVKKYKRMETRGTIINFSYVSHDIRSITKTYSPVTLEVIGKEIMYSTGYSLIRANRGKLALLNGGRVHVYGGEYTIKTGNNKNRGASLVSLR